MAATEERYGGLKPGLGKSPDVDKSRTFFYSANDIDKPCSSPSRPNVDHVVKCVCTQIQTLLIHSVKHHKPHPKVIPIFCEDLNALGVTDMRQIPVPETNHMQIFMAYIINQLAMSAHCSVICLIYLERLITDANVVLHPINWRRLVVISLLMASKVWEDAPIENADIVKRAFPFFSVADINAMEFEFLTLLDYNLTITAKEYLEYYFSLRELGGKDFLADIKKEEQKAIQIRLARSAERRTNPHKSFDMSQLPSHSSSSSSVPSSEEPASEQSAPAKE